MMRRFFYIGGLKRTLALAMVLALLCVNEKNWAQGTLSNLKTSTFTLQPKLFLPDTLDIINGSVVCLCGSDTLNSTVLNNVITLDTSGLSQRCPSVQVWYRTYPFALRKPLFRFDSLAWQRAVSDQIPIEYDFGKLNQKPDALWQTAGLNTTGAYTRGLALGNNQNLNFNSDLNLQLSGRLGNDIEVNAAIADNSVPVQPDGSTRNIQEFDRIFVQLKRKNSALLAGDFELAQPNGRYFSRYYKKVQGAQVSTTGPLPTKLRFGKSATKDSLTVRAAAAISRGKFNRILLQGQEGNQGPYRLQGAEGERFIIILAGTEKVLIDGVPMRRGQDDDYIIDYNLGEITFTARRLITKDIRIVLEFEYVVQQYLRTTLNTETEWRRGRKRAYLSTYSEQDNPNTSGIQDLRPSDKIRLAAAGDSVSRAFSSGVDTLADGFDPNRVLYKWLDTLVCGVPGRVLAYSTNRDSAILSVRWSEVPTGQGNYVLTNSSANGRVYAFSPPDPVTCQPTGQFEPVTKLTAPEQKQIFAVGGEILTGKTNRLAAEVAMSNRDANRFSQLDKTDDRGIGIALSGRQAVPIGGQKITLVADYELAQDRFRAINPYRAAEFTRDWNTEQQVAQPRTEQLARVGMEYALGRAGTLSYAFQRFDRAAAYTGTKHVARTQVNHRGMAALAEWNQLETEGLQGKTTFLRPKLDLSYLFRLRQISRPDSLSGRSAMTLVDSSALARRGEKRPFLQVGTYLEREKNPRYGSGATELQLQSFWYDLGRFYIRMPEQRNGLSWEATRSRRLDYAPRLSDFLNSTQADELAVQGVFAPSAKQRLTWNLTRRDLQVRDTTLSNLQSQKTWLGRADYSFSALKNALSLNTGYEIGSGQNPKLEFTYIRVNPGEGTYSWIDRNLDSLLTVDEMEIAVFQDQASYVRLAVTTNQFIQTNSLAFNQNIRFEPRVIWARKKGTLKTLSKFSVQSSWQLNRKTKDGAAEISPWNPFLLRVADTALVSISATGRQTLFFQRAHPRFETSVSQATLRNRYIATTGFESRGTDDWNWRTRYNPKPAWTLDLLSGSRRLRSDAEFFNTRDYAIREYSGSPELSYLHEQRVRAGMLYRAVFAENSLGGKEKLERHQLSANISWQPKVKRGPTQASPNMATALRGQASMALIDYSGQANTPVAFVMMEGLQNGRNFLWNFSLDRQLSKFMQMNISYEGRKPGVGKIVHVGRAQVRAIF
jgi:hypothetical protein